MNSKVAVILVPVYFLVILGLVTWSLLENFLPKPLELDQDIIPLGININILGNTIEQELAIERSVINNKSLITFQTTD